MTREPEPWWKVGACLGQNPATFLSDAPTTQAKAKAICATCLNAVKLACLDDALTNNGDGVRGGLTEAERQSSSTIAGTQVELKAKLPPKSEHGTEARAKRHRRDGEIPRVVCLECAEAEQRAHAARRERRIDQRIARRAEQRALGIVAPEMEQA
jgi:hypothetical protein